MPYGVGNRTGQVGRDEGAAILNRAWEAGLNCLDTAIGYGESELRLGALGIERWRVITKLPAVPDSCGDVREWVQNEVSGSLNRLKVSRLYGLLLHCPHQLKSAAGASLYQALASLKAQGKIDKLGVSIYEPVELESLLPRFKIDLVQAPFSIVDRRIDTSGWLRRLKSAGIEVHVRSIFLQGLLLMTTEARPAAFSQWRCLWERWQEWLAAQSLTPLQACLRFALSQSGIDRVVVGVDSLGQLEEILASSAGTVAPPPRELMSEDLNLVNPSRWKRV